MILYIYIICGVTKQCNTYPANFLGFVCIPLFQRLFLSFSLPCQHSNSLLPGISSDKHQCKTLNYVHIGGFSLCLVCFWHVFLVYMLLFGAGLFCCGTSYRQWSFVQVIVVQLTWCCWSVRLHNGGNGLFVYHKTEIKRKITKVNKIKYEIRKIWSKSKVNKSTTQQRRYVAKPAYLNLATNQNKPSLPE